MYGEKKRQVRINFPREFTTHSTVKGGKRAYFDALKTCHSQISRIQRPNLSESTLTLSTDMNSYHKDFST